MKNYDDFINEFFRNKRLGYLDQVQNELTNVDGLTVDDYNELKNNHLELKKIINRYIIAYNSTSSSIRNKNYYIKKMIENLEESSVILYKMFKYARKNDHDIEYVDNQFEKLSTFYSQLALPLKMKKEKERMDVVTYVLNSIDAIKDEDKEISKNFYVEVVGKKIKYRNRRIVDRATEEHRDIDPFGEEDWLEN